MQNILIAGGNGLIGKNVSAYLRQKGYGIRWLVRKKQPDVGYPQFLWNPATNAIDLSVFQDVDVIIHLSGSPISSGRWTATRKSEILQSRLQSVRTLCYGLQQSRHRPAQIIQGSAIGYFGDRPAESLNENNAPGTHGFLSQVTQQWESEAQQLEGFTEILTIVRTGLYLHPAGGIWPEITMTLPFHVLPYFGKGDQMYSWIHHEDYHAALEHCFVRGVAGAVHFTAPHPVSNKAIMKTINTLCPGNLVIPVPAFLLKIILGDMSSMLLDSCEAIPEKLLTSGFQFRYPFIEQALASLINKNNHGQSVKRV